MKEEHSLRGLFYKKDKMLNLHTRLSYIKQGVKPIDGFDLPSSFNGILNYGELVSDILECLEQNLVKTDSEIDKFFKFIKKDNL